MRRLVVMTALIAVCTVTTALAQPRSFVIPFSTTTAQAVASYDAIDFRWVSVQIESQGGSSVVTFQTSNDNTNWVNTGMIIVGGLGTNVSLAASSVTGIYHGPLRGRYFRLNVTGIASGTTAGTALFQALPSGELNAPISLIVPGTAATNLGKAEDAIASSGDAGVAVWGVRKDAATTTTSADGDYAQFSVDAYGASFARVDHPNRIHCTVTVSTATTITAVGGSCVAPGAGLSIYVTDIMFSTNGAGVAADTFNTLKYGTGGTCGAGTAVFWGAFTAAITQAAGAQSLKTPIKIPANNEICWINSTAGSKFLTIDGFIAP